MLGSSRVGNDPDVKSLVLRVHDDRHGFILELISNLLWVGAGQGQGVFVGLSKQSGWTGGAKNG